MLAGNAERLFDGNREHPCKPGFKSFVTDQPCG
jgi:hypothetical protein